MALTSINAQALPPGFYAVENAAGRVPAQIADFSRAYILVEGDSGEVASPVQITSLEDAETQFGVAGIDAASISNIFIHNPRAILYAIRVPIGQVTQIGIATIGDDTYSVTIGGTQIDYVSSGAEDADTIVSGLIAAINDTQNGVATTVIAENPDTDNDTFEIRTLDPTVTVTVSVDTTGTGAMTSTDITGLDPTDRDAIWTIRNAFDTDIHRPGFMLAPGLFATMESSARVSVGQAMADFCTEFDWLAIIDPGSEITTKDEYQADALLYNAPRGHVAYYCPWITNLDDLSLPPSSYAVSVALQRFEREGFRQPPAGSKYPLRNCKGVSLTIKSAEHAVLNNDHGINVIKLTRNGGYQILGARTRTDNKFFNTITDRVIFNVLLETLRNVYDGMTFESIDGQLELFRAIRRTGLSVLARLWDAGALFGASPQEAFEIICDRSNNSDTDLENGRVNITIYAVPSPFVEKLVATVNRVAIGEVQFFLGNPQNQSVN